MVYCSKPLLTVGMGSTVFLKGGDMSKETLEKAFYLFLAGMAVYLAMNTLEMILIKDKVDVLEKRIDSIAKQKQ